MSTFKTLPTTYWTRRSLLNERHYCLNSYSRHTLIPRFWTYFGAPSIELAAGLNHNNCIHVHGRMKSRKAPSPLCWTNLFWILHAVVNFFPVLQTSISFPNICCWILDDLSHDPFNQPSSFNLYRNVGSQPQLESKLKYFVLGYSEHWPPTPSMYHAPILQCFLAEAL